MKQPLTEGKDYYLNEEGLLTFTARYHLERGYCCGQGCRHCPYRYEAVPEPRWSRLLAQRDEHTNSDDPDSYREHEI